MKKNHPTILLVDDDPNDLMLLEMAFEAVGAAATIHLTTGGREAIDYLSGAGQYANRAEYGFPNFIITDLKMPGIDGFGVLEFLKTTPQLSAIPTVIFSGSSDNDDIKKAYWLGAASYHVKPSDPAQLRSLVKALHGYWTTCDLPEMDGTGKPPGVGGTFKLGDRFAATSRSG